MQVDQFDNLNAALRYVDSESIIFNDNVYRFPLLIVMDKIYQIDSKSIDASFIKSKMGDIKTLLIASDAKSISELNALLKWPLEQYKIGSDIMSLRAMLKTYMILLNEGREFSVLML